MKVTSKDGLYDMFKCRCPRCGVEVEYSRRDIRPHRRWSNGFIYCPRCKSPIGHDNNNFTFNRLEKREEEKAAQAEKRVEEMKTPSTLTSDDRDLYAKQIKKCTTFMILFLIFGLIFMIGGTAMLFIGIVWATLVGIFLIIPIGIALIVVRAAVFGKIRTNKIFEVERYDHQHK